VSDETRPLARSERTRNSLLDAAQELFVQQGYAATSMRQVAENAECALGGIYNHFPSKEAIFQAVLMEHHPYPRFRHLLTPANFDREHAKTLVDELEQEPEFFTLMLIELVEFKGKHLSEVFEKILHDLPPPAPWRALLSMMISYHITRILLANTMPPGAQQISPDAFIDTFLNGILKPE
jgi:AcrR family transcriptional regulator